MSVQKIIRSVSLSAAMLVGATAAASATASDVQMEPGLTNGWQEGVSFDLLRDCPRPSAVRKSGEADVPQPVTWETEIGGLSHKEELGPNFVLRRGAKGPVLQFAALGAGKKERPGLAHVALDWSF